jgi:hypothetical protein
MSEHDTILAIRWVWAAVFFGLGIFLTLHGGCYASARKAFKGLSLGKRPEVDPRLEDALARREAAEGPPAPIGRWTGFASLALSFAAVFSPLPVGLLYALLCFVVAMTGAATFLQLRNVQRTRVALLSVRTPENVIPPIWFVLAFTCALLALIAVGDPAWTGPSVLVCCSSIFTMFIAWRLTQLGAILSGEDVPAEQIVDERVRFYRSSTTLMLAFAQPFIFISQMYFNDGLLHWAGYFATCLSFIAFFVWMMRRQRAAVRLA